MVSYFMPYASPGFLLPVAAKKYQYDQFDFSPFNIFPLNFFLVKYPALMKSAATVSFFFFLRTTTATTFFAKSV